MNKNVVIIGAGPGGLASAILLAASGVKVKVLERLPTVGGRTSSIEADGFKFDLGPTFFLYPRVLEEIFAAAGTSLVAEVEMVRLDPQYRIIFGEGGELHATSDIARMEQQIAAIAPGDAPGFRRFLDENRTKLRRMEPCLETPFLGWQDLINMRLLKMLPMLRPHQSIDIYLKRFFRRPAHSPGVFLPIEISRHVAVPLPEPLLDSLVPRIRIRRVPSDRRLRRGDRSDGARGRAARRRDLSRSRRSKKCSSKADARSACARPQAWKRPVRL